MIIPTSTGQVFVYDESSIKSDNPPIAKLDDNHIFVQFVKEFWHKITTPGAGDPLMNAYAMLLFDINVVPDACRQYICTQLRQTPPDIVLINDLNPLFLGFQRTPNVWPYISIHKAIVDRWADGMARFPNERQTLAAEALLKMTIVHEGGHWHYKLACRPSCLIGMNLANHNPFQISIQRVGQYTNEMMHLQNGLPKTEGLRQYQALSAKQQEEIVKKHTFKSISVPWNSDKGESGYFSEYKAVGGIMGFDLPSETCTLAFYFFRVNTHILPFQYSCAQMLAIHTFCQQIISSPFEKGAFFTFTRKEQRFYLNPSQKLSARCRSGQILMILAQFHHPTNQQSLLVSIST